MPVNASPNKFETERNDVLSLVVASPAPGVFANWLVPANRVVQLVGIVFRFVTNAVVGNRWPYVFITSNGLLPMHRLPVMQLQPENADIIYAMHIEGPLVSIGAPISGIATYTSLLCPHLTIKDGERLRIGCFNIDPGDRIQNILIRYREWKED